MEHAHDNGLLHLNLHAGNILYVECADREREMGFYLTDFGDPLLLDFESAQFQWNSQHERIFTRMLKFYPPHILNIIKHMSKSKDMNERRSLLTKKEEYLDDQIDMYCVGTLMLFVLLGRYDWGTTLEMRQVFD